MKFSAENYTWQSLSFNNAHDGRLSLKTRISQPLSADICLITLPPLPKSQPAWLYSTNNRKLTGVLAADAFPVSLLS